ncbi:MAG: ferrous iron transporter B [Verrucomicrobia bacterium CG_4_10_14_3_um_filter_43_23]|nr:MAG: ferrous iron transporter B [Verrucomicrobia bacterium CG22_combo_CG10-13_8_21_14_all_43_17]PIX58704.1 MAG: ferrous iron transporter B [Verrucomicrobia bacterium CG_4_10_14_3_um_filter_43_23]PIY62190.1 MAG: ferrous iron transporter B [Verrucomicrobia bacterium CG_4_10_14_0_8_um_filter_43_34]PJA44362.1 MAG: ferrous iron transporter B [Verrucomicrobia bacterium CG_4_9_14_3_um_filter_43_20]
MKGVLEHNCSNCPVLVKQSGVRVVALVGAPNVGKSTLFNTLTGLRQHTGNWPGKTSSSYAGLCSLNGQDVRIVDLPGVYTLRSTSLDESATERYLKEEEIDLAIVVMDPMRLGRSLNLLTQVMALRQGKPVMAVVNLMDEAEKHGVTIDFRGLSTELRVPILPLIAREKKGIPELKRTIGAILGGLLEADGVLFDFEPLDHKTDNLECLYRFSAELQGRYVLREETTQSSKVLWQQKLDGWLTSKWTGIPIMLVILAGVFWITIIGANYPSDFLHYGLIDVLYGKLSAVRFQNSFMSGLWSFLVDGLYLSTAWVVAVMLPPILIFFPLFTLLEDFGYLPRVAFNMDALFKKAGGNGKQALTMAMGYGCNAAGVIAARIIESPRERLLAIITNNFAICNGRWPLQILLATIFIGALFPSGIASFVAAGAILAIVSLGLFLTLLSGMMLSKTVLKGKSTFFVLELPPYRRPKIGSVIYRSMIDRTLFVLLRAILFALPAGAVTWLLVHITVSGDPIAGMVATFLNPFGAAMGLSGIILLAYVIAIPANELVIPAILMLTVLLNPELGIVPENGVLFEFTNQENLRGFLKNAGWTALTAVCLMVFSLSHNPCSTTLYTIYKETKSIRWTAVSALLPLFYGVILCIGLKFTFA